MRKLPFFALFLLFAVSCKNENQSQQQNTEPISNEKNAMPTRAEDEFEIWDNLTVEEQEAREKQYLSKYNFNQTYTLKGINNELGMLFEDWDNTDTCSFYGGYYEDFRSHVLTPLISERIELHLKNPLTLNHNLLRVERKIYVEKTPDEKCKIYSFNIQAGGNNINHATYFQFKNHLGETTFYRYNSGYEEFDGVCDTVFQFKSDGKNYYMIPVYEKFGGKLYIFSIDNGRFVYHNEFFPDEDSRKLERWNSKITFNPITKTVSTIGDAGYGDSVIERTYTLVE